MPTKAVMAPALWRMMVPRPEGEEAEDGQEKPATHDRPQDAGLAQARRWGWSRLRMA